MKYKAGDKVRIIKPLYSIDTKLGDIMNVVRGHSAFDYVVEDNRGEFHAVYHWEIELVEVNKMKIGLEERDIDRELNNQYRYGEVENYEDCTKNIMKVRCKGHKPSYTNKFAAGLDLRSNTDILIHPGQIIDIESKLAVEIPEGHFGMVVARSGLSYKRQIKLINDVGIIDEDYRNDIGIRLINEGEDGYLIKTGDRVAQMIILPYIQAELEYVEELSKTDRKGGFGSTGR